MGNTDRPGVGKYWIIRCPNCHQFMTSEKSGKWKLCPTCGEILYQLQLPIYLEVNEYSEAEELVDAVEEYLKQSGRPDLSPDEVALVREKYKEWING